MVKINSIGIATQILLLVTCPVASGWAAPAITGVSGNVQDGQIVTISGSGFGASGPNVVLFDAFEKGSSGSNISSAANSANIGNWTTSYKFGLTKPLYSNDYSLSGSNSMKIDWRVGYGSGPSLVYPNVQNSDILISWWQYMPTNRDVPGTNNSADGGPNWKWFWIGDQNDNWPWGSDYVTTCLNASCSSTLGVIAANDTQAPSRDDGTWYTPLFSKGVWMRVTVAMRNATSGGYIWNQEIDGSSHIVPFNLTNQQTAHSDDPWNALIIPGFGRLDSNGIIYIDDVYVATGAGARARVEIGNASTYSASTKLAFITPTSWNSSQIKAIVQQGVFKGGETVYLFVVDASGNASPGYGPLTLGQSSEGGQAPAPEAVAPAGLKIITK